MNTKELMISILLLISCFSSMAYLTMDFDGWNPLEQRSSDIIIARCSSTPDPFNTWKDGRRVDFQGIVNSEIQIISVLKGATNFGLGHLTSEYWPRQGENYLIFASYRDGYYQASEKYRIVPLGVNFHTNSLTGKTLDEKIQILLQLRLDNLTRQMQEDNEEKQRLEAGVKK